MPGRRSPDTLPLQLSLTRDAGVSLHRQLYVTLRSAILDGRFAPGQRLPATRTLATDLGVSRTTVLQAYDRLLSEGYAVGQAGGGTRVAGTLFPRPTMSPASPASLTAASDARPAPRPGYDGRASGTDESKRGVRRDRADGSGVRLSRGADAVAETLRSVQVTRAPVPFALGVPALDQFPIETWARLTSRRWRRDGASLLEGTDERGYPPLREAVARYAVAARGVRCTADEIMIVNGAQHAIDLVARLLLDPGDTVWLEEPGYAPALATMRAAGAHVVGVPVDEAGLVVSEGVQRAPKARIVFVTPSYQAPLGVTMSLERRLALLAWAAESGAWIIEDDYNGEYRYDTHPVPAMQGLDPAGRVIYVGTFSKTLTPALRMGYMVVPAALMPALVRLRLATDRHSPVATQAVLADFIAGGHFARHVRRTRELYRRRQADLVTLAAEHLGSRLDIRPAPAGMRVIGLLPPGADDTTIARRARAAGVIVEPLSGFVPQTERPGLVLGYAPYDRDATRTALLVLRDVIDAQLAAS